MIGSFVSGSFIGLMAVKAFVAMGPGLAGMAMFVDPENAKNIVWAFVGFGISLVTAFLATLILYKDEAPAADGTAVTGGSDNAAVNTAADDDTVKPGKLVSPMEGKAILLEEVKDEVFSTGVLGQEAAIIPEKGELYFPVDGEVTMVPDTKHAIAVKDANGAEILMHIGMDTVQLNGKGYDVKVKEGDHVKSGQLLITFDIDGIKAAGYDVTTPIVITNSDGLDVKVLNRGKVERGNNLLSWR